MNTRVDLLYRDGCNYAYSRVVFAGEPTPELVTRFLATRDNGDWIVTEQVGLTHPALESDTFNNGRFPDEEDDHGYTEVEERDIEATDDAATDERTFAEFVEACERAQRDGWDPDIAIAAAGGWSDPELCAQLRGSYDDE
jgi:hypothetical protein